MSVKLFARSIRREPAMRNAFACIALLSFISTCAFAQSITGAARPGRTDLIELTQQIGHFIDHLAISQNDDIILSTSQTGTLKVWRVGTDSASSILIRTIYCGAQLWDVAISADGKLAATAHDDVIKLWELETGRLVVSFRGPDAPLRRVRSVVFFRDGKTIMSAGDDGTARVWDTATGNVTRTIFHQKNAFYKLALSIDETVVATGDDHGALRILNLTTGKSLQIQVTQAPLWAVAISPKGDLVATGGGEAYVKPNKDTKVRLWEAGSGKLVGTESTLTEHVQSLDFSPDGQSLLATDTIRSLLWNISQINAKQLPRFERHTALFFHKANLFAVAGSYGLVLRSSLDGSLVREIRPISELHRRLAVSPKGQRFASIGQNEIGIWDSRTGQRIASRRFDGRTSGSVTAYFTPDSESIVVHFGLNVMELWNAQTLETLWSIRYDRDCNCYFPDARISFSQDGRKIVLVDSDNAVRIFELETGANVRTVHEHNSHVIDAQISQDNRTLTRLMSDGPMNSSKISADIIDLVNGGSTPKFAERSEARVTAWFLPGGRILTVEYNSKKGASEVKIRETSSGTTLMMFDSEGSSFDDVDFSSDGGLAAFDATRPKGESSAVEIWDLASGRRRVRLPVDRDYLRKAVLSNDGKRIISAGGDGVKIWDIASGDLLASIFSSSSGDWLTMTPAGFFVGSAKGSDLLSVVRGFETYSVMQFYEQLNQPDLVEELLNNDPEEKYSKAARDLSLRKILNSGPAPALELVEPRTEVLGSAVRVRVRIKDEGGGIGKRVVWRVDGQARGETEAPELQAGNENSVVVEQILKIAPAKVHSVQVVAYNKAGLLASVPLAFSVSVEGAVSAETRMHVLAIGVTNYEKDDWRLNLAAGDATAFAEAMQVAGRELFTEVKPTLVLDKDATARGIEAAFAKIARDPDLKPNDVFVLYIAGHGRYDGARYYFIPQDFNSDSPPKGKGQLVRKDAVNQDTLQRWIASVQVDKRLVILDTCESAEGAGAVIRALAGQRLTAMEQLQHATGDNLIAAAGQAAFESNKLGHGLLTYAILEALAKGDGVASDEKVTTDTIASHASERVPVLSREIFGQEQWPIRKLSSGVPIPLGYRRVQLKNPDIPAPLRRNFILMRNELVRTGPDPATVSDPVIRLQAPMIVNILEYNEQANWVRIQWGSAIGGNGVGVGWVPVDSVKEPNITPK